MAHAGHGEPHHQAEDEAEGWRGLLKAVKVDKVPGAQGIVENEDELDKACGGLKEDPLFLQLQGGVLHVFQFSLHADREALGFLYLGLQAARLSAAEKLDLHAHAGNGGLGVVEGDLEAPEPLFQQGSLGIGIDIDGREERIGLPEPLPVEHFPEQGAAPVNADGAVLDGLQALLHHS